MKIQDVARTGDTLFLLGNGCIEKVTFSNVRHVAIVYDPETVFETDIWIGKAKFNPISKYADKSIEIWQTYGIDESRVKTLCEKYKGAKYSKWDIFTNFITAGLHPAIRQKIVSTLGSKSRQICSELSARIIYEAEGLQHLSNYESLQPVDLRQIYALHPEHHFKKYIHF